MKKHKTNPFKSHAAAFMSLAAASSLHAGTITSSTISGVTSTVVDITGKEGYGYFSVNNTAVNNGFLGGGSDETDGNFSALTNQVTAPAVPTVLTTVVGIYDPYVNDLRAATAAQIGVSNLTFNGNLAYGANGGYPPGSGDLFSLTFNDLAAGDYSMSFYFGHTSDGRTFSWSANLTGAAIDTEGPTALSSLTNLASTVTGNYNMAFYNIAFTAAANDDLTLTFNNGAGGGTGGGVFNGYTVDYTAVPEPTSALAGLLIAAGLLRRRRK